MKALAFLSLLALSHSAAEAAKRETIAVTVTENGFEPSTIKVKPGTEVTLDVTRKTDITCAKEIVVSDKKIEKKLPLNKAVKVPLGKLAKGEVRFACGMKMIEGRVLAE